MPTLLREIAAAPRPTGSAALAAARERCARELAGMGLEVRERPFSFSSFPGRFATPLIGGAAAALVGLAGQQGSMGIRYAPFVILALGALALFAASRWLMLRGVLAAPLLREGGVNLEASRSGETPRVWLCAHLDTKSQPVPTLLRTIGVAFMGAGYLGMLAVSAAALWSDPAVIYWGLAGFVTLAGAVPVVLSTVGAHSPGALDNASGVVTLLEAARLLDDVKGIGVLITDAEELGMAGARAWVMDHRSSVMGHGSSVMGDGRSGEAVVLNCDGVDDTGRIAVMYTGRRPGALLATIARASAETGVPHEAMRMIPGLLTDSVAFTDAGLPSVTFMRGSVTSLFRVHSRRDSLERLRGTGVAQTAALVAAAARAQLQSGDIR